MMRAFAAVIRDGKIVMVRHRHGGHDYWTLPGGHVEAGERPAHAARRELREETGLDTSGLRELYRDETGICFLGTVAEDAQVALGSDPELAEDAQWIVDVAWFDLPDVAHDDQVSQVIARLWPAAQLDDAPDQAGP